MKKSDIGVIAVIYAVAAFFYVQTNNLPEEAQTYPRCLIYAILGLNTLYLILNIAKLSRQGLVNDLPDIFSGFLKKQFFFVLFTGFLYVAAMFYVGFYLSTIIYLAGVMLVLHIPKLHILIAVVALSVVIYFVFTRFLKVPLPAGELFN
ncbi:MAG: tripartite tricarboxylate transporter TctB family protein [Succinivibrio sp.]|nr:tripartite tricarboxylate transporter TctB family protein [Succinivibrio sp.]